MELRNLIYLKHEHQPFWFRLLTFFPEHMFRFVVWFRTLLYKMNFKKRKQLPGFVLSIGNLAVGGTGKTPVVIEVAKYISNFGLDVAILTRGYKSGLAKNEFIVLQNGKIIISNIGSKEVYADEAMMQSHILRDIPVIVGINRYEAAQRYLALSVKKYYVWILDDGFQHTQIDRDLNVLLLDAKNPFGSESLLPRGFLREPIQAIERASAILWTRSNEVVEEQNLDRVKQINSDLQMYQVPFYHGRLYRAYRGSLTQLTEDLHGNNRLVIIGIAKPDAFLDELVRAGVFWNHKIILKDHEFINFDKLMINLLKFEQIVTTAKDYYRNPFAFDVLPIPTIVLELKISIPESFFKKIEQHLKKIKN